MKTTVKSVWMASLAITLGFAPLSVALASDTNPSTSVDLSPSVATPAPGIVAAPAPTPVKLPYGVDDVLKLSRAQVGEDVILNYVRSSGTIYNLTPKEIVYLRDQGVSEKVINVMIDQRKVAVQNVTPVPSTGQNTVVTAPTGQASAEMNNSTPAPVYTDPNANTYAEAPLTPPASSVYVIPYAPASYAYYGPYGYPYYGGWYGPSIAFGFRFGHGYYGRGFGGHGFGGHGFGGRGFGGHGFGGHGGHR